MTLWYTIFMTKMDQCLYMWYKGQNETKNAKLNMLVRFLEVR